MPDQLQLRGGSTTEHNSFTGAAREVTVDTTKKTLVVHDGSQAGGTPLMKESGSNAASTVGIGVGGANKITINADGHVDIASNLDCAAGLDVTGAITCTGGLTVDTDTLFVNSSNNRVGINTTSPGTTLSVSGTGDGVVNIDTSDSRGAFVRFGQGGSFHNMIGCADGLTSGDKEDLGVRAADNIIFAAGGSSEKMRINSSGRLLVGTSSARSNFFNLASTHTPRLQVESTNNDNGRAALGLIYGKSNASGAYIVLAKHRSDSVGGNTVVQSGDETGIISFQGSDGSQFVDSARIESFVDGTPGANDMPGRLVFSTTADGAASPTERMRIDSSGNVSVGGTSPSSQSAKFQTRGTSQDATRINMHHEGNSSASISANGGLVFGSDTANGTTERMRIDSSGNVGIGTATIVNESEHKKLIISGANGNGGGIIEFQDTSNNSDAALFADNGSLFIIADRDNTTGNSNIVFRVDGSSEKMRIDSSGRVMIGTSTAAAVLTLDNTGQTTQTLIQCEDTGGSGAHAHIAFKNTTGDVASIVTVGDNLEFRVDDATVFSNISGTESMRIDSTGSIHIGRTDTLQLGANNVTGINLLGAGRILASSQNSQSEFGRQGSDGEVVRFACQGTGNVGSIDVTASSTSYNTSSDYRLKENVTAISDGITRLKTLKPSRFNFKVNKDKTVDGFLAHEVTAVPEAITGTKDEVATEDNELEGVKKGDPIYQKIDQSKLVPLLVAAVQELIGKVEALEAA